jgi:hypothetical protein
MADPFREHRFSAKDVRRILRRAAELAEHDAATAAVERSLTREELERAAADLGLPASALARAAEHAEGDPPAGAGNSRAAPPSVFFGAPTRLVLEKEVEGEPGEADREDLLEDIRDVVGDTGTIESMGKTLIWRLGPVYRGNGRDLSVRLRARDGRTRIVVEERFKGLAAGLFVGIGFGAGFGPMGGYILAIVKLGAVGLVFPLLWIPLMVLLARTLFVAAVGRRRRALENVMRRLEQRAASWPHAGASGRARIAASTETRVEVADGAADDGEEAEAEEAAEAHARR